MARFTFQLEPVLRQRRRHEQDQQRIVAELERDRRRLEGRLRELQEAIAGSADDARAAMAAGRALDVALLRRHVHARGGLERRAQTLAIELAGVLKRLEEARAELARRAAARRAVELLREQRLEAWKREQDRSQANQLDDLVQARLAGAGSGGDRAGRDG